MKTIAVVLVLLLLAATVSGADDELLRLKEQVQTQKVIIGWLAFAWGLTFVGWTVGELWFSRGSIFK